MSSRFYPSEMTQEASEKVADEVIAWLQGSGGGAPEGLLEKFTLEELRAAADSLMGNLDKSPGERMQLVHALALWRDASYASATRGQLLTGGYNGRIVELYEEAFLAAVYKPK